MPVSRRVLLSQLGIIGVAAVSGLSLPGPVFAADGSGGTGKLKIGVVGAGWLGGTVARRWVSAGHQVMFSSRNIDDMKAVVRPLGENALAETPLEAATFGQVILFAVPYDALPELGKQLAGAINGKVVLDACNPSEWADTPLTRETKQNGVGVTSMKLLPGSRLVRVFNSTDASAIESSGSGGRIRLGVPLASNDKGALEVAARLVTDAGCDPVITGDFSTSRGFEAGGAGFRANTSARELRRLLKLS
ncbi:NAD(P)-binding domain-containing protein [Pantoea sp. B9002]|uniref:NADPH-dependent F420 reductase n=1 Tax=Pantoea sp. B9002 TaxID=2726979 RepID=UPI0015A12C70|nr:NAD(P)-binding domain-containing protein [Pantoea sp. B9002]NWA63200.1 NAD(P)-binding domain-containing protein [Pantoea sp. B9002]